MRIFAMKLSFWKGPGSFCEAVLKSGIRGVLLMRLFLKLKYNVASCFYSDLTSLCNTKIGPWYQLDHCENFQWRFDGLRSQKRSFWIKVTLGPFYSKGKITGQIARRQSNSDFCFDELRITNKLSKFKYEKFTKKFFKKKNPKFSKTLREQSLNQIAWNTFWWFSGFILH